MTRSGHDHLEARVAAIVDPHAGRTLGECGAVRGVGIDQGRVRVEIRLGYPAAGWHPALVREIEAALAAEPGVESVHVDIATRIAAHKVQGELTPLPQVKNIIAVASGKGGVGKSTTAVNLALALVAEGARAGVLDADIYGPSVPRMLGLEGRPETTPDQKIVPRQAHGLQAMSIGLLIEEDTPMIWRGPMVSQALQQLLGETRWENLDYLIIDLPPGTGDTQLTLAQKVPVSGAVIVTTPQDIALLDARKALKMFEKVEVPVLGLVENMAVHVCSSCGQAEHIFGEGGGRRMAEQYDVPLLASLPLDRAIREQVDGGNPTVVAAPDSAAALAYRDLARRAAAQLSLRARNKAIAFPEIVIQNS
ncbi:MAG TPA: iron-sulfur cluster carrier protein ApbC [Xanthomonadaceae bacterium]|nr:iron-sulfur cluster carrier protein ApbC [Xanthomonadaceae bacterium]